LAAVLSPYCCCSSGEPSIHPRMVDRLIGIGVLVGLGIANALSAYRLGYWLHRRGRD